MPHGGADGEGATSDRKENAVPLPISVAVPHHDGILAEAGFADAFSIEIEGQDLDAMEAARRAILGGPKWAESLLALRNILVRPLGLKTGAAAGAKVEGIGIFPVLAHRPDHLMLGMDDRHLDFRLLIDVKNGMQGRQTVTVTTRVKTHNALGRAYLALVMPFHKRIVPAMLASSARPLTPSR
jgi:hypothetical protein